MAATKAPLLLGAEAIRPAARSDGPGSNRSPVRTLTRLVFDAHDPARNRDLLVNDEIEAVAVLVRPHRADFMPDRLVQVALGCVMWVGSLLMVFPFRGPE